MEIHSSKNAIIIGYSHVYTRCGINPASTDPFLIEGEKTHRGKNMKIDKNENLWTHQIHAKNHVVHPYITLGPKAIN